MCTHEPDTAAIEVTAKSGDLEMATLALSVSPKIYDVANMLQLAGWSFSLDFQGDCITMDATDGSIIHTEEVSKVSMNKEVDAFILAVFQSVYIDAHTGGNQ